MAAQEKAADILILSSHTEHSEWAQHMLQPIQKLERDRPDLDISLTHLPFLSYSDVATLEHDRDSVLALHTLRPKLVILLGGSCFSFAPDVQKRWDGIPMLLIGEQDYYCDLDYTIHGPGDPNANRYPVSFLLGRGYNLTLISAPPLIHHTVDMILQVQPELEKLIYIVGENYISKERQWRLEEVIREYHSNIHLQIISSSNTSTDQLISRLEQVDDQRTAVLYGSWMVREGYHDNVSTRHNTVSLIERIAPVYTMFRSDFEKHPYVVGYYSYSAEEYDRTLRLRILDIVDNGIPPTHMSFAYLEAGVPTLNYDAMEHFRLNTDLIPENATIVNAPLTLWQTHRKPIMWLALVLLLSIGLLVYHILKRAMRSMNKARHIAEKANGMKTAFIQNMSHEFRTPLNSIIGFSQLLCMPDEYISEEEKAEYLDYITNNSRLLTVMVNDMLSISDMEKGIYSIRIKPTNVNEMARQAIKAAEFRWPAGVSQVRLFGVDEDVRYLTDGMRVLQILINFLTNACKHTTSGEIAIGNSLTENPGFITFYVADTGPGVPADMAESIFERFVKLDNNKQGAGLGLSICRMMAEKLGGKVWLDTRYTKGARFVFTIPAKEA